VPAHTHAQTHTGTLKIHDMKMQNKKSEKVAGLEILGNTSSSMHLESENS